MSTTYIDLDAPPSPARTGVDRTRLVLGSRRELATVTLVSALAGGFAAVLVMTSRILATLSQNAGGLSILLDAVSGVFILISLYVAAVVTSNCVATVLSGRLRHLALLRLLGAQARQLRRVVCLGSARAGLTGALLGLLIGTLLTDLVRVLLVSRGTLPAADYPWLAPQLLVAAVTIVAVATAAGWFGSRTVLRVTPAQALTGAVAPAVARRTSRVRSALAVLMIGAGAAIMALAMYLGEEGSAAGFMIAFLGCALSGTGLLVGARLVIPRAVSALGLLLGRAPAQRIARRNAVLDPVRTTHSTMGLVLGVALVTTFAAGSDALRASVVSWGLTAEQQVQADQILSLTSVVMISLVVVSSVIAAVGFVSTMSLTVLQRSREIGLLRALGFTRRQIRAMITGEAVALSVSAVVLGAALGVLYGTVGAQSLIGALNQGLVWGLPWPVLGVTALSCGVLVLAASQIPARRAVRLSAVEALRIES